ncbi:MAG: hypothetical protein HUU47_00085 [Bacteroidetes bacterium]|nr:hypothetical protein [Bacteroidota bacterium]
MLDILYNYGVFVYDKKNKILNFWYSSDGKCQWFDFAWECFSVHFNDSGKFIYKNRD